MRALVLVAALLLGGCAGATGVAPEVERPGTTLVSSGGGLQESCMSFGPGVVLLLAPVAVIAAPFLLVYAVVGTPIRVLARLNQQ